MRATTLYAVIAAITFSATSSAPTPLYHLYQQSLHLSALAITLVFAAYAFAMLGALLTVAKLSDYVGRRPMILAALLLNALALVIFIVAGSAEILILARVVQGVATGIALATLGAAIVDTDPRNGAVYNSFTAFLGLTVGSLLAGALVSWAPLPTQLVYMVLLAVSLVEALVVFVMPETIDSKPGALRALLPNVAIPAKARPALIRLMPLNLAAWALGGFYLSLMPTLVAVATGSRTPFTGAAVVAALMLTGTLTVLWLRSSRPERLVRTGGVWLGLGIALTLVAIQQQSAAGMLAATVVAGVGFGATYSGNLRTLLPLAGEHERAGLLAAYFVESYLFFAIPAIGAGILAPVFGLVPTAFLYGGVLIALSMLSLLAGRVSPSASPLGVR
ncbi:multidrug resistance protein D [Hartmannibacter diazotrophicus]|uniref:Multidrug resistance protein D n=1 Tax=Hartmannibacter diazotrophicus TaxID=1482074 RepID=A0A2C9D1D6_9HYPH|nr:MFS transporter [Hartmannibacter diazotrophicus]SON54177.1 multidrug resistance protein D [Hartmannibacter diazotrophicus]